VLFDLDGTLVDTWRLYIAAYSHALAPIYGHPPTIGDLRALKPVSELRLLRNAVGAEQTEAYHRAFVTHYERLHDELCEGLSPGVAELLATLRARGWRLGLVTGKSRAAWDITAARCGLGPFDVVVTDEDVREPKPDPQGLRLAAQRLGVAPAEALYVGDGPGDQGAARAAGMPFAAVLWCKGPREREAYAAAARAQGALACLERPQALLALLPAQPDRAADLAAAAAETIDDRGGPDAPVVRAPAARRNPS
jgi:pyrophosphatase PpaX